MGLLQDIAEDTKKAMKEASASEEAKLTVGTLRMLSSEIKYKKIAKKAEMEDEDIIDVINSMVKKRRESAEMYEKGNRSELAEKEQKEIAILRKYLPAQLSDDELETIVEKAIADQGIDSIKMMGKLMGSLVPQLKGQAEPSRLSALIKKKLTPPQAEQE